MDRDVYLILIGAGISLASSLVTLLVQFLLGQVGEAIRRRKDLQTQLSKSIRSALTSGVEDPERQIASAVRMRSNLRADTPARDFSDSDRKLIVNPSGRLKEIAKITPKHKKPRSNLQTSGTRIDGRLEMSLNASNLQFKPRLSWVPSVTVGLTVFILWLTLIFLSK